MSAGSSPWASGTQVLEPPSAASQVQSQEAGMEMEELGLEQGTTVWDVAFQASV